MTTRAAIVAEAMSWQGTPWRHQGRVKGVGVDCIGVVAGVAMALGALPADFWQVQGAQFNGYSRQPSGGQLLRTLQFLLREIDPADAQAGDVVLIAWTSQPQHVGILVPYVHGGLAILHGLESTGKVSQHRLAPDLRSKVCNVFSYPGVTD